MIEVDESACGSADPNGDGRCICYQAGWVDAHEQGCLLPEPAEIRTEWVTVWDKYVPTSEMRGYPSQDHARMHITFGDGVLVDWCREVRIFPADAPGPFGGAVLTGQWREADAP